MSHCVLKNVGQHAYARAGSGRAIATQGEQVFDFKRPKEQSLRRRGVTKALHLPPTELVIAK
jgi:hypothetical protein